MSRHFVQLMEVAVCIRVAEASPNGLINKKQIGELIPRTLVVFQRVVVLESVWANLHQGTVHGTASRPTIQPDHCALSVCNMSVLVMPEEEVAVGLRVDLDVSKRLQD
jgi:hypothetical protein